MTANSFGIGPARASRFRGLIRGLRRGRLHEALRHRGLALGSIVLVVIVLFAIFGPLAAPSGPLSIHMTERLQAPSGAHLLGTDNFGRDLLARISTGGRVSLLVGLSVALIAAAIGLAAGLYAASNRIVDAIIMRLSDGFMAFPGILLAIGVMAALGASTWNLIATLGVVSAPIVARIVRASALVEMSKTYVEALRSQGASLTRVLWLNVLPNVAASLLVAGTFVFAEAIVVEASLSFVGAGVPAPNPSWGNILFDGKAVIYVAWWMTLFPGVAIAATVLSANLIGDGMRDLFDPHGIPARRRKARR